MNTTEIVLHLTLSNNQSNNKPRCINSSNYRK